MKMHQARRRLKLCAIMCPMSTLDSLQPQIKTQSQYMSGCVKM